MQKTRVQKSHATVPLNVITLKTTEKNKKRNKHGKNKK